jgi:hypothetical protein
MADELSAEQTPGFKVGEKKTIDEYQKLGKINQPKCDKLSVKGSSAIVIVGRNAKHAREHQLTAVYRPGR